MGASASVIMGMTAEDICVLAERRKRPRVICDAIRSHEIDGPTLLVLDCDDVASLASASSPPFSQHTLFLQSSPR